jgi:hypothetical protein
MAIDVSFMGHSTWSSIHERARAAGVWCYGENTTRRRWPARLPRGGPDIWFAAWGEPGVDTGGGAFAERPGR